MQPSTKPWNLRKVFGFLPDFWFLAILLLGWGNSLFAMFNGTWSSANIIFGVSILATIITMIIQLFKRRAVISSIMGVIFLLASIMFTFALFAELSDFSNPREPQAIQMMLCGGAIILISIAMSTLMLARNTLKINGLIEY